MAIHVETGKSIEFCVLYYQFTNYALPIDSIRQKMVKMSKGFRNIFRLNE